MTVFRTLIISIQNELALLSGLTRNLNFWIILISDILIFVFVHFLAYFVRFEGNITDQLSLIIATLPLIIICKLPVFYIFSLYKGMWRYTSLIDLNNIVKATFFSIILIITYILYTHRFEGYSRSVFFLDGTFTLVLVAAHRFLIRFCSGNSIQTTFSPTSTPSKKKKRLLLIGAGSAAEQVVREVLDNKALPYKIVGFVDDAPAKIGRKIHGIQIFGFIRNLETHIQKTRADELLIAIASATAKQMKRITEICQQTHTKFKVLPGLGELIYGKISIKTMREISYKDLLGRAEIHLEQDEIGTYIENQTILVTGAGGSIGSELCRQILRFKPKSIIILDSSEEHLYTIQMEIIHEFNYTSCIPILDELQDSLLLDKIFSHYQPQVIFHAAAYKHVPLIEINPWKSISNNILSTKNLIEASIHHKVKRFVLVSTDKAVRPTNIMGASKRVTELIMMAYGQNEIATSNHSPQHRTIFQAVRFGNVLGSSGSVVPLFKRQIELGGPITVTHPDITRYFMSIEEAAQLILQAGSMGSGNEIFILQMGQPIKIVDMAKELIRLSGREPETEIEIKFTGLRQGEKLYEELITVGEGIVETSHEKIMVLRGNGISYETITQNINELIEKSKNHDYEGIKKVFKKLVLEYTPDEQAVPIL